MAVRELAPGFVLGKYEILEELGRGGMGVVFLAKDRVLDRCVAVKVLNAALAVDRQFLARFDREAKAIAAVSHPNVVHVHAFDVIDNMPLIEMEYLEGGSWEQAAKRQFLTLPQVLQYAAEVLSALAYCHAIGAIHRDVKPSNILFDKHGHAHISDFGIAKLLDQSDSMMATITSSTNLMGTPQYAPPEAWEGKRPTPAWDMYSLGVILYETLTGRLPFRASTPMELVRQMATSTPPSVGELNPSVPVDLCRLIHEMLEVDPDRRLNDAQAALNRLTRILEGSQAALVITPHSDRPTVPSHMTSPLSRTKPLVLTLLISVVILFIAVAGWTFARAGTSGMTENSTAAIVSPDDVSPWPAWMIPLLQEQEGQLFTATLQSQGIQWTEQWLLQTDQNDTAPRFLALGNNRIALAHLERMDTLNDFVITGEWAEYRGKHGTVLRYGTMNGKLHWEPTIPALTASLIYLTSQDGTLVDCAAVGTPLSTLTPVANFVYELENNSCALPLLYNELIPRDLAWAFELEAFTPSYPENRAILTVQGDRTEITLDGALNEVFWSEAISVPGDQLDAAKAPARPPQMQLHALADALAISVLMPALPEMASIDFQVSLIDTFTVPANQSAYFLMSFDGVQTRVEWMNQQKQNAQDACEFVLKRNGDQAVLEGWLSAPLLLDKASNSLHGVRMRMSGSLQIQEKDGDTIVIGRWGLHDEIAPLNGVVLHVRL